MLYFGFIYVSSESLLPTICVCVSFDGESQHSALPAKMEKTIIPAALQSIESSQHWIKRARNEIEDIFNDCLTALFYAVSGMSKHRNYIPFRFGKFSTCLLTIIIIFDTLMHVRTIKSCNPV